ncbi:hypothetical protein ABT063_05830 [Streptomyces sp. NPDC002838]|uniref:hypothetical protein n=1 Tax=Streptomyces sp. NPDC002838 TaxID=3154436 RepID=UPI003328876E
MTQSGQGEEPSAREAREGIVLPSDGGEPLLPGMTGGYGGRPADGHNVPAPGAPSGPASGPASAPPGGQSWGTPWGPDQHQAPAPPPGQGWSTQPAQPWNSAEPTPPPAWGTPEAQGGIPQQGPQGSTYGTEGYGSAAQGGGAYGSAGGDGSLPGAGHGGSGAGGYGSAGGDGSLPAAGHDGSGGGGYGSMPSAGHGGQGDGGYGSLPPAGHGGAGAYGGASDGGAPLPPAAQDGGPLPSAGGYGAPAGPGDSSGFLPAPRHSAPGSAPLPAADEGATQYIPPVAASKDGATQYPRTAPSPADEGATQYIPPVGPGALPPEVNAESPAESPSESTQILGRVRRGGPRPGAAPQPSSGPGPMPSPGPLPPAAGPDAEATQYIPPVPGQQPAGVAYGGDRQTPAEFDNLFRSEPGGPAATQQLPLLQQPEAMPGAQAPYTQSPQPSYAGPPSAYDDGGGRGRRAGSRVPLIAAVGVGIAVLGIGAGALLAGGGDDKGDDKNQTVSATAPATDGSASPSADPAKQQAVALDRLLADSGDSRASVINAVANVKACKSLGQAAKDLREAAGQRNGLVTRLSALSVDKLPNHAALTDALTKAWKASASADNHYAAWADQAAGKKGCKKGQARVTGQTQAGNRASGTASTEKVKAAQLWNTIAKTYGLTQRQPTQL